MRKFLYIIAFFFFINFISFKSSASALPEISQTTLEVIEGGMSDAINAGASYKGFSPYTDGIIASSQILSEIIVQVANINEDASALYTCDSNDCYIRALSSSEIEELENNSSYHLFDRLGNIVDYDDCYKIFYDNGYLSGSAYVDQYGDILYYEAGNESIHRQAVNIIFGGNLVDWEDWNNFYDLMSNNISENNGSYNYVNGVDITKSSVWYCSYGSTAGGQPQSATSVLVQNCNIQGLCVVVPSNNPNISSDTIYYNDGANIYVEYLFGRMTPNISNGDYYLNGYHYTHQLKFGPFIQKNEAINDYHRWRYENYNVYDRLFGYGEGNFATSSDMLILPKNPQAFKLLQVPEGSEFPALDEGASVDISDLPEIISQPQSNPIPNPNFKPSQNIDFDNFPLINPSVVPIVVSPSILPYPDLDNAVQPGFGGDIGQITPEGLSNNIPIISDLRYRFPFSIPFDIHDMIQGLVVTREAPHFEWEIYFPVIDFTWVVDFDLSAWDTQAGIFRTCFLILFIIALGMWAYNHFFGS